MANGGGTGNQPAAGVPATTSGNPAQQPVDATGNQPGPPGSNIVNEWLAFFGKTLAPVLLLFGAAFGAGIGFDQHCWKEKADFLKDQSDAFEKKLESTQKELTNERATSAAYKAAAETCKNSVNKVGEQNPAPGTPSKPANAGELEVQIFNGETVHVSRQLFITLVAIEPSASPPTRYKAIATLGAQGLPNTRFEGFAGDVQSSFAGFEIRILDVDAASARFHIRKLSSTAATAP